MLNAEKADTIGASGHGLNVWWSLDSSFNFYYCMFVLFIVCSLCYVCVFFTLILWLYSFICWSWFPLLKALKKGNKIYSKILVLNCLDFASNIDMFVAMNHSFRSLHSSKKEKLLKGTNIITPLHFWIDLNISKELTKEFTSSFCLRTQTFSIWLCIDH